MTSLTPEAFERWWTTAVRPDDAQEFVHGPWRGTQEAAYFCCAYDILRSRNENRDIVVQAYLISQNIDPTAAKSAGVRIAAQGMYDEDSVQFLLDKVEYRKRAEAEERIHAIAVAKIEELNLRSKDENFFEEYTDRLATEKLVLDASLRYMTDRTKQKSVDMKRREQRALRDSMVKGKAELKNVTALPTKEEIRQFAVMAREMLTDKEFAEIFNGKALNSGE